MIGDVYRLADVFLDTRCRVTNNSVWLLFESVCGNKRKVIESSGCCLEFDGDRVKFRSASMQDFIYLEGDFSELSEKISGESVLIN